MPHNPLQLSVPESAPRAGSTLLAKLGLAGLRVLGWQLSGAFANEKKLIVVVAPHRSNWDWIVGVCALWALRLKFSYFIKDSVMIWPLSLIVRQTGGIPVDRNNPDGVITQIAEAFKNTEKLYFAITPEGTRKEVSRWKSGFLRIAYTAELPVVPAFIDYTNKTIHVYPPFELSGNVEDDMSLVQDSYKDWVSESA